MPETTLTCSACGKTGTVTQELLKPDSGAVILLMTGLDPGRCEGCRETLNRNGYAVTVAKPHGDGSWTLESAQ